jgi:hypothetical protein
MKITPEKLLQEYKNFIEITAKYYSKKDLEYDEAYNQCYLYLLENCPLCDTSIDLRYCVRNKMRNYYRNEMKGKCKNYGLNPEPILYPEEGRDYGTNPEDIFI